MKDINITNHGFERVLERTHCKRGDIKDHISKVWLTGKTIEMYNAKNSMAKYLKNVCVANGTDRSLRVKGNLLYLFNKAGNVFITCYQIPEKVIQSKR